MSDDAQPISKSRKAKRSSSAKPDRVTSSLKLNGSNKKKRVKLEPQIDGDSQPKKKRKAQPLKKENGVKQKKELKKLEKGDRIGRAMQSFLWWDAKEPPEGCQWATMEHAGVSFTEKYEPHGVKMIYDGKEIDLSPAEEEA